MYQLLRRSVLRCECDVVHVVWAWNVQRRCRCIVLHDVPQRSDRHHKWQHNVYTVCSGNVCVVAVDCVRQLWSWTVQRRRLQRVRVDVPDRAVLHVDGRLFLFSLRCWSVLTRWHGGVRRLSGRSIQYRICWELHDVS